MPELDPHALAGTRPVLVYNRVAQNRRKTVLLVALALLAIVPFVLGISYAFSHVMVSELGARPDYYDIQWQVYKDYHDRGPGLYGGPDEWHREIERRYRAEGERLAGYNHQLGWVSFGVTSGALMVVLGLLFWAITSSPTSKLLALAGARPASEREAPVRRLLENLAIGAGLPPPRLYVIGTLIPNAFAAGLDPRNSVVAVTDGLLKLLDHRELEGVLAHEMSHIGNHDTRLNTVVASIALFLRLPYLLRQKAREQNQQVVWDWKGPEYYRDRLYIRLAFWPVYLYVFFIAPVLAAVIRAAISRSREYLADADAALLTRNPEGLVRALAKIAGAGSVDAAANPVLSHLYFADALAPGISLGLLKGRLLATHPPIQSRVQRLVEFGGASCAATIESAVTAGRQFVKEQPPLPTRDVITNISRDELSSLTLGSPGGRVCRIMASEGTPVYDQADSRSRIVARLAAGAFVVVFDDPGRFRGVVTVDQTFGYIPLSVKLQPVDMLPAEIHDPAARQRVELELAQKPTSQQAITRKQMLIAAGFGIAVFAGILLLLTEFGGK